MLCCKYGRLIRYIGEVDTGQPWWSPCSSSDRYTIPIVCVDPIMQGFRVPISVDGKLAGGDVGRAGVRGMMGGWMDVWVYNKAEREHETVEVLRSWLRSQPSSTCTLIRYLG